MGLTWSKNVVSLRYKSVKFIREIVVAHLHGQETRARVSLLRNCLYSRMAVGVLMSRDCQEGSETMKKQVENVNRSITKDRPQSWLRKLFEKLITFYFKRKVTKTTEFGFGNRKKVD